MDLRRCAAVLGLLVTLGSPAAPAAPASQAAPAGDTKSFDAAVTYPAGDGATVPGYLTLPLRGTCATGRRRASALQ
jgi:hypothetical protein